MGHQKGPHRVLPLRRSLAFQSREENIMSEDRGYSGAAVALGFILGGALGASLALLYAPEYLIAAAAGLLSVIAFLRWRRAPRVGKGYPSAPALREGRP